MPFDVETAIPVREREDGLLEKDIFDIPTANSIESITDGTFIRAAKPGEIPYRPPPIKARANVELMYKEVGEEVPAGLKFDWELTSPRKQALTGVALSTVMTGGLYPVVQAVKGLAAKGAEGNIMDKLFKGITYPEATPQLYRRLPGTKDLPPVAEIIADISESIIEYGVLGLAKAALKRELLARSIIRKLDSAAELAAKEKMRGILPAGPVAEETTKNELKTQFKKTALEKLTAVEAELSASEIAIGEGQGGGPSTLQSYARKRSLLGLIIEDLQHMNEAGQIKLPKIGQTVGFKDAKGIIQEGIIKEITDKRVTIDMMGRQIVVTLSQLNLPKVEQPTGEGKFNAEIKTAAEKIMRPGETVGENVARTKDWIASVLDNDEASTNAELVDYFQKEGGFSKDVAEYIVSKRKIVRELPYGVKKEMIQPSGKIQDLVNKYNEGDEQISTVEDVVNGVEDIISEQFKNAEDTDADFKLQKAIDKFRKEQEYDRKLSGRGDMDTAREKIMASIEKYSSLSQPTGGKPPVKPKPSVLPASQVKKTIRETTGQIKVGGVIKESEALKRMLGQEEKLSKQLTKEAEKEEDKLMAGAVKQFFRYEDDIAKLEEELKISNFNTEAEKVKAQYKLENLKQEYAEVRENQRQKKALRDEVKDLIQDIQSAPTEDIAVEYQGMIEQLKSKFDLKKRQERTLAEREGMKTFVERMKIEGRPIDIPAEKLAMLDKVNLEDMTLDQLRQVSETISNLEKLGKTKLKAREAVYVAKKERIKTELVKEATPIKSKILPKVPIGDKVNSWVERAITLQNYAQKTGVGLTPIDGLADVTGMKSMKKALDADFSKYLTYNDEVTKQWYGLTKDFTEKEFERIGVIAASRQEGGLERLANSGITEEEVSAIKLTPAEEKAYQFVLDTFDKEFPAVKQYSKEVYNADVGEQENYVSFMSDYELMSDLEIYERFGQTPEQITTRKTKTVEQGFTKERATISNIKLETNIDKIFRRHMDDVAYMLNTGKNIKMYFEVINSPEMREKLGDVGTLAWLQWLDLMARKGGTEGAKRIAALDILRRNIGAGVLAFRLSSALVQFSSFSDTIATIGTEWATKGATNIAVSPEWRNFIMDNFPEVKKAVGDDIAFREFGEGFLANLTRVGTKPLQVLDGIMRSVAASGSYQKLAAEKGIAVDFENPNLELVQEATRLMRQSQGSSFFKDQPLAITAGYGLTDNKSINKTILTFQSFMLARWDNINRQVWRMGIKEKNYGKAISSVFWLLVFAGAVEEGIRRGSRKITGALAQDKKKEQDFVMNVLLQMIQSVPLVGQLVSSITYSSNPVPVINTVEDILEGAGNIVKGKTPETKLKGIVKTIGASGSLAGIPGSSQAAQIIKDIIPSGNKKKRYW